MLGRSLPVRIAILSSFFGGGVVLVSAFFFGAYQRNQIKRQVLTEARNYAERFTTWTLGYFYQQDNLLHLETQQRFLAESPNILYSYIVKGDGKIDVGLSGISSSDVGSRHQVWEPELPIDFNSQTEATFKANSELASKFRQKVESGDEVLLVGYPILCPERTTACAQLRVAMVPQSAQETALGLTLSFIGFGIFAAAGTGLAVFYASRKQVLPIKKLTSLMDQAHQPNDEVVQSVRASLEVVEKNETTELKSLKASLQNYLDVLELSTAQGAVARSTQAFAHDVRKPFSMFKAVIESLESTSDISAARELVSRASPEINRAMKKVDVMIKDIMQVGGEIRLNVSPNNPVQIILGSLREVFSIHPDADIQLFYRFNHRHAVVADPVQISRVFFNIIENAVQAAPQGARLWLETSETDSEIEFLIRNSGSSISPEAVPKLFDLFYTANKVGGTGLGLSIVKKIVELHGGHISCTSTVDSQYPDGMVEFKFSVPKSTDLCENASHEMPAHSRELVSIVNSVPQGVRRRLETDPIGLLIKQINLALESSQGRPMIYAVDDEQVYLDSLMTIFKSIPDIQSRIEFRPLSAAPSAADFTHRAHLCLLIQDLDLGSMQSEGLNVIRSARTAGFKGLICVHSNRFSAQANKLALDAGADVILPKPMSRSHFIKLVAEALVKLDPQIPRVKVEEQITTQTAIPSRKPNIIHVDDSEFILYVFKNMAKGRAELKSFSSPRACLSYLNELPSVLESVDAIVTDYFFAETDQTDGLKFACEIRSIGYQGPIILLSDAEISEENAKAAGVSATFKKDVSFDEILNCVGNQ